MSVAPEDHIPVRITEFIETSVAEIPAPDMETVARSRALHRLMVATFHALIAHVQRGVPVEWGRLCSLREQFESELPTLYKDETREKVQSILSSLAKNVGRLITAMPHEPSDIDSGDDGAYEGHANVQRRITAPKIIAASKQMREILKYVDTISGEAEPVLIVGESGVGKELIAQLLHCNRGNKHPYVAINCGAVPENLLESELFGHVRGSFTDAHKDKQGLLSAVGKGTLFLDEIGDMPLQLQVKLLRVLQEKSFRKIGGTKEQHFNGRVVAATNVPVNTLLNGKFRQDLYYRLAGFLVEIPALRERPEDIKSLIREIMLSLNSNAFLTDAAKAKLLAYDFPGNVRELENVLRQAHSRARTDNPHDVSIDIQHIDIRGGCSGLKRSEAKSGVDPFSLDLATVVKHIADTPGGLGEYIRRIESDLVEYALAQTHGNRTQAAQMLGINRTTLVEKLRRRVP